MTSEGYQTVSPQKEIDAYKILMDQSLYQNTHRLHTQNGEMIKILGVELRM